MQALSRLELLAHRPNQQAAALPVLYFGPARPRTIMHGTSHLSSQPLFCVTLFSGHYPLYSDPNLILKSMDERPWITVMRSEPLIPCLHCIV